MHHLFRGRSRPLLQDKTQHTRLLPETALNDETLPQGIPAAHSVVITISGLFGSGAEQIGRIVAAQSGLLYLDSEILSEVARRQGVNIEQVTQRDEQITGSARRILEALRASSPFLVALNPLLTPEQISAPSQELRYWQLTRRVILELATTGNAVIIGRGSQFLLHGLPRTLHAYIFAPRPYRLENVMRLNQLSRRQAAQLIERRDLEQETYYQRFYGADQDQLNLYHLLINTTLFSFEQAASLIKQSLPVINDIQG